MLRIAHLERPNFALRALPGLIGGPTLGIRIVLTGPSTAADNHSHAFVDRSSEKGDRRGKPQRRLPQALRRRTPPHTPLDGNIRAGDRWRARSGVYGLSDMAGVILITDWQDGLSGTFRRQ